MSKQNVPAERVARDAAFVAGSSIVATFCFGPLGGLAAGLGSALMNGAKYNTNPDYHED